MSETYTPRATAPIDEQVFIALQEYEQLRGAQRLTIEGKRLSRKLSFTDIVHCVREPQALASNEHLSIINQSIDYRRKYRFVLKQIARLQSPRQIAASTNEHAFERKDERFTLSMKIIEHDTAQVNMTLHNPVFDHDLTGGARVLPKQAYLHSETDDEIGVVILNEANQQGEFSALMKPHSDHFAQLTNINAHLYVTF
jgi:hypothetical protein